MDELALKFQFYLKLAVIISTAATIAVVSSVAILNNEECDWGVQSISKGVIHYAKTCGGTLQMKDHIITKTQGSKTLFL